MNIAVLAVSLLYVLNIIFLYFFIDVGIFILFISFNLVANYMTLTQFASYKFINISYHFYTFEPSNEYFWPKFAMKSEIEISPCDNFV